MQNEALREAVVEAARGVAGTFDASDTPFDIKLYPTALIDAVRKLAKAERPAPPKEPTPEERWDRLSDCRFRMNILMDRGAFLREIRAAEIAAEARALDKAISKVGTVHVRFRGLPNDKFLPILDALAATVEEIRALKAKAP